MIEPTPSKMPIVIIACRVFQHLLERAFPAEAVKQTIFLEYGLHSVPRNLSMAVQEAIDALTEPSLVVLGYGLCGNGLNGIRSGRHTLLIARADDCIAILLGSYEKYQQEFQSAPGTYYLTKGWLESGSNPLSEYLEYREKYGEKKAEWLIDAYYHNYKRIALVAHSQADLEKYRPQAHEVARFCERWGMRYEEIQGSEAYLIRLVQSAVAPDQMDENFVMVPPGGELRQEQFLRFPV
jgi:hypothetical protein